MYTPEIDSGSVTDYCESSPDLLNAHDDFNQYCNDNELAEDEKELQVAVPASLDTITAFSQLDGFAGAFLLDICEPSKDVHNLPLDEYAKNKHNIPLTSIVKNDQEMSINATTGIQGVILKEKNQMSEAEHIKLLYEKLPKIQSAFTLYNTYDRAEMKFILRNGNIRFNGKDDKSLLANRLLECMQEGRVFKAQIKQGVSVLQRHSSPNTQLLKKRKCDVLLKSTTAAKQPDSLVTKFPSTSDAVHQVSPTATVHNNIYDTSESLSVSGTNNSYSLPKSVVPKTKQRFITMFNPQDYKNSTVVEADIPGEPSIKSTSSKEEYTDNHGISVVNQIDSIESMGKVCDSGLSVILDKCTLRDSNSYPLQQALRRGEGFFLFPHIQLMKHTDNLLTSDHLNFNENQANKKVNKVQLLQSAVDSFKSHLLTNHFQIAPSQFLDNLNNSLQGNNKLLIEPTLTAVKSITFPFQKLGIFLNQVTRAYGKTAIVIQSVNPSVTTCEKTHRQIRKLICVGDELITINGSKIQDIFDVPTYGQNDALLQCVGKLISELPRPINIGFISTRED